LTHSSRPTVSDILIASMSTFDAIQRICNLPADFRDGEKSAHDLIREAGIDVRSLTTDSIAAILKTKPELVTEWLQWSEDKRSSPGYYFLSDGQRHIVGYYPGDEQVEFADPIAACADFVVKEVNAVC
jgi:hypothetical protein